METVGVAWLWYVGYHCRLNFCLLVRGRSRFKMWAPLWSCLLSYLVILWPMARCTKNHALPHLPHPNNATSTARPTSAATPFVGRVHLIAPYAEDLKGLELLAARWSSGPVWSSHFPPAKWIAKHAGFRQRMATTQRTPNRPGLNARSG